MLIILYFLLFKDGGIGSDLGHDKWLGLIRKAQRKDEKNIYDNKHLQELKDQWRKMGWING